MENGCSIDERFFPASRQSLYRVLITFRLNHDLLRLGGIRVVAEKNRPLRSVTIPNPQSMLAVFDAHSKVAYSKSS
jgi:hypothetical protein